MQLMDHACDRIENSSRMYSQRYSEILCRLLEYYPKARGSRGEPIHLRAMRLCRIAMAELKICLSSSLSRFAAV